MSNKTALLSLEQMDQVQRMLQEEEGLYIPLQLDAATAQAMAPGYFGESSFSEDMAGYGHTWTERDGFILVVDKERHLLHVQYGDIAGKLYLAVFWVLDPEHLDEFMGVQCGCT